MAKRIKASQEAVLPQDNTFDFTEITKQMELNAYMLMKKMTEHFDNLMQSTKGWINVKERTPPNDCSILFAVWDGRPKVNMFFLHIGYRLNNLYFYGHDGEPVKEGVVTHWMQLPDKPKMEDLWKGSM